MMKKRCLVLLLCLSLIGCKEKETTRLMEKTLKVTKKKTEDKLFFSGEIRPLKEDAVVSPAQATILKMFFNYGMRVKKGDVLAWLDSPEMQRKYDEALTAFLTAKDTYNVGSAKFSGTEKLWASGLIAKNSYDAERSSLHTNQIALIKAKNALADFVSRMKKKPIEDLEHLSLSDLDKVKQALKERYNRIELKASIDGVALEAPKSSKGPLRVGSQLSESDVVTLIGDTSGLSIVVKVAEINIDKIKTGMKAKVRGVAFPDMSLDAKVSQVNAEAISSQSGATGLPQFNATIIVPHLTERERDKIRVGMSATVEVSLASDKKIMIPIEALSLKDEKNYVTVKTNSGEKTLREVVTGTPTSSEVEIKKGLKVGDTITWVINKDMNA